MTDVRQSNAYVDRATLWLQLATEDAVRAANVGDPAAAVRRTEMARRVGAAFAATGVTSPAAVEGWTADTTIALAARGVGRLAVGPWWAAGASGQERIGRTTGPTLLDDPGQCRRAVSAYTRWLASALVAGWPTAQADAPAIIREAADAFRYVGVVDPALEAELATAVEAVAAKRFPDGWPTPPWAPGARSGRAAVEGTLLATRTGTHRISHVEGGDDGWWLELDRVEGFVPPADPVWAVDDRSGLYFGAVLIPTSAAPRIRLQPALQAAAASVTVHVGVLPQPSTVTVALDQLVMDL